MIMQFTKLHGDALGHPLRQIDLQFSILHELKNKEILDNVDRLREYWFGSKSEQ